MSGEYIICSKIFICVLVIVALLPVLCWALDHVARFLRRNFMHSSLYRYVNSKSVICFIVLVHMVDDPISAIMSTRWLVISYFLLFRKYLEDPCLWVETNNTILSLLCSNAEITLGFLMIISLFSCVHLPREELVFVKGFLYVSLHRMLLSFC